VFAIEEIILKCPEQADSIIYNVLSQRFNETVGFHSAVFNVLSRYGKDKLAEPFKSSIEETWNKHIESLAEYKKAVNIANQKILTCLSFNDVTPAVTGQSSPILFQLSAFLDASSHKIDDVRKWDYSFDMDMVTEVFMLGVTEIDHEKFSYDIQDALSHLQEDSYSLYEKTTHIDIEPEWEKAKQLNLDTEKIEKALYHHSDWVVQIAANLLINITNKTEMVKIIEQIFDKGKYAALWAAAQFSKEIDRVDLIVERLQQPLNSGCQYQYLFQILKVEHLNLDKKLLNIIENGLMNAGPLTATEAAEIAGKVANSTTENLEIILIAAFKYWQKHEQPYPESVGIIPDSPREKILKALFLINHPKPDVLFEYCSDTRSDVRNIAKPVLMEQLCVSSELRKMFLQKIDLEELKY
jgi:hypothetical protein